MKMKIHFFSLIRFSDIILYKVIGKIRKSWYQLNREIRFFCYYPFDEFISCLMTEPDMEFPDEIGCQDLFKGNNNRERILIFEMK